MGKNPLGSKAGVFLGDALKANSNHPICKLSFKSIRLGENGLLRIIEALNACKSITRVHLGIISSQMLLMLAKNLTHNSSLLKLKFQEDPLAPWKDEHKAAFIKMLKTSAIPLTKVKFDDAKKVEEDLIKLQPEELDEKSHEEVIDADAEIEAEKLPVIEEPHDEAEPAEEIEVVPEVEVDPHEDFKEQIKFFVKKIKLGKRRTEEM